MLIKKMNSNHWFLKITLCNIGIGIVDKHVLFLTNSCDINVEFFKTSKNWSNISETLVRNLPLSKARVLKSQNRRLGRNFKCHIIQSRSSNSNFLCNIPVRWISYFCLDVSSDRKTTREPFTSFGYPGYLYIHINHRVLELKRYLSNCLVCRHLKATKA